MPRFRGSYSDKNKVFGRNVDTKIAKRIYGNCTKRSTKMSSLSTDVTTTLLYLLR